MTTQNDEAYRIGAEAKEHERKVAADRMRLAEPLKPVRGLSLFERMQRLAGPPMEVSRPEDMALDAWRGTLDRAYERTLARFDPTTCICGRSLFLPCPVHGDAPRAPHIGKDPTGDECGASMANPCLDPRWCVDNGACWRETRRLKVAAS